MTEKVMPNFEADQCDLDRCTEIKDGIFDFAQHREPENYKLITETKGVKIVGSD